MLFFLYQHTSSAQTVRILFLVDASGSMMDKMEGKTRWDVARNLLVTMSDSIEKANSNVEFGVRIFGHQSPKSKHNCQDSKLEIPFAKKNAANIFRKMKAVHPQGYTPIAYSIYQAANDFPIDAKSLNAIIMITDGIETCDGDPCAAATLLEKKRISLKPFIIGMGIADSLIKNFNCIGTYFDAKDPRGFKSALNTVVSQVLGRTTVQVNLLNKQGVATETNLEITFTDAYNGDLRTAMVHSMKENGTADTLRMDPIGKYNLTVHSYPPVVVKNISLTPGRHNIIAADVPQGSLQLTLTGTPTAANNFANPIPCVVRRANSAEIINVQDFNSSCKYLIGEYDLEVLSLPPVDFPGTDITANEIKTITLPQPGTLTIGMAAAGQLSIYYVKIDKWIKVKDWGHTSGSQDVSLQPGDYNIVYKPDGNKSSEFTQTKSVNILSGKTARVTF